MYFKSLLPCASSLFRCNYFCHLRVHVTVYIICIHVPYAIDFICAATRSSTVYAQTVPFIHPHSKHKTHTCVYNNIYFNWLLTYTDIVRVDVCLLYITTVTVASYYLRNMSGLLSSTLPRWVYTLIPGLYNAVCVDVFHVHTCTCTLYVHKLSHTQWDRAGVLRTVVSTRLWR